MAKRVPTTVEASGLLLPPLDLINYPLVKAKVLDRFAGPDGSETVEWEIESRHGANPGIDDRVLDFIVEQALAQTVRRIGIDRDHALYEAVMQVDKRERRLRNLVPITKHHSEVPLVRALFGRLAKEFQVEVNSSRIGYQPGTVPDQLASALLRLYRSVHSLALGIKHRVQIDIPLDKTKNAVNVVRRGTRDSRTASDLATLYGILDSYETTRIEGVELKSKASPQLMDKLQEVIQERLMDDDVYWALSICGSSLGIPRRLRPALVDFSRLSRNLLHHSRFRLLYRPARFLLQLALKHKAGVKVPLPSSREFAELIDHQYFPPIRPLPLAVSFADWFDFRLEQAEVQLGLPTGSFGRMRPRTDDSSGKDRDTRKCSVCGEVKSLDEFYDDSLRSGYGRRCRACKTARQPPQIR